MIRYFLGKLQRKNKSKDSRHSIGKKGDWSSDNRNMENKVYREKNIKNNRTMNLKKISYFWNDVLGSKTNKNSSSIKRRKGNEIENGKESVEMNEGKKEKRGHTIFWIKFERKSKNPHPHKSENNIGKRSGKGNKSIIFSWILKISWIYGNRFSPTESNQEKSNCPKKIDMFSGIESEAPLKFCCIVSERKSSPGMCRFMHTERN